MPLSYNEQAPEEPVQIDAEAQRRVEETRALLERKEKRKKAILPALVVIFGIIGVVAPWFSIMVAKYGGITALSMTNSAMLLFLSALIIVFLMSRTIFAGVSGSKKTFLVGAVFLLASIISFSCNLAMYISIAP